MKRPLLKLSALCCAILLANCSDNSGSPQSAAQGSAPAAAVSAPAAIQEFQFEADRFADIRVLRYQVPGFENFTEQQKELLYYLTQAGMSGRDIMWDQNYRHNLRIRRTIEAIIGHYPGDRNSEEFQHLLTYAKQMWFASGIHHHYSSNKFTPLYSSGFFADAVRASAEPGSAQLPLDEGQSIDQLISFLEPIIFDPSVDAKKTNTSPDVDKVLNSAVNFYEGVTEAEVDAFYEAMADREDPTPVSYGLNSKLVKENGRIVEKVWKLDGMYGEAIEKIVYWLEKAATVAENDRQRTALELLVQYYRTGNLRDFDAYNVAWVQDTDSAIDAINGFIEVYNDPLGYRGSFESVVAIRDEEATRRIGIIAQNAQWFEDNSPILPEHKKPEVVGITGRAITVVSESGDASPSTPVGINLPNQNWIRVNHGSKSVSLNNIVAALNAAPDASLQEFAYSDEEIALAQTYGELGGQLLTDMHEVIGHASGRISNGVGSPRETLRQYASPIEEGRADLVALYYLMDPRLVELGVMPSLDVGRARYSAYIRSGLMTQLYRIEAGQPIEQAHMRNRQTNAAWAYERGLADKVIERITRDGKTYFVVNDFDRLREIFGELLREHQRIVSEGDFAAAQHLIETYGTQVDQQLHAEVLARFANLNVAPYSGFINPRLVADPQDDGRVRNVRIEYPDDFIGQMLEYAEQYSFLPHSN
jgi:dipeptidyl-peptidase III